MNKILVVVLLLFVSRSSMAQRAFTDDQLKKEFPRKEVKYKLAKMPFELSDTSFVSINAVYILQLHETEWKDYKRVDSTTSYTYMRFFNDGRVYISFAYLSYPTAEEFNDLSYGKYGRYVVKDGKITVEFYMNRQYGVMFMFATPVRTGVQFYATSGGMKPLFIERDTTGGYYRKDYTDLYTWPD